jgi:fatty acid desaturase
MNDASTGHAPRQEHQLRAARALLARELGAEQLALLHEPILALDLVSVFGSIALFLLLAWELANGSVHDPLWWACLFVQADLVVVMSIVNHDVFVHRKMLPTPLRWVLSQVLNWPAQIKSSLFESRHLTHHRELATERDPEFYKRGLDSGLRRLLYVTPALIVFRSVIYRELDIPTNVRPAHGGDARLRWEKGTRLALWALALATLAWDWRLVVFGYLLPFALITPAINTLRIVLEHFDVDRGNPLWVGTFYRTGFITRPMFLWSAGDCHMVHHYYANIPFYRMPQALRLMRPVLLREGVYEHRSLLPLMVDWFSAARGHWTVPSAARPAEAKPAGTAA